MSMMSASLSKWTGFFIKTPKRYKVLPARGRKRKHMLLPIYLFKKSGFASKNGAKK
jgi:hypothetical protein